MALPPGAQAVNGHHPAERCRNSFVTNIGQLTDALTRRKELPSLWRVPRALLYCAAPGGSPVRLFFFPRPAQPPVGRSVSSNCELIHIPLVEPNGSRTAAVTRDAWGPGR